MRALGEAATRLPWLSPCAAALTALARGATNAWEAVRHDPGAVLLVVRRTAALVTPAVSFFPALVHDPAVVEGALEHLDQAVRWDGDAVGRRAAAPPFVDWNWPAIQPVYHSAVGYARLARRLAESTGRCDPDDAWVTALLAPLGWFAVCATDPEQAGACL